MSRISIPLRFFRIKWHPTFLVTISVTLVTLFVIPFTVGDRPGSQCNSLGQFQPPSSTLTLIQTVWSWKGFFSITLGFGRLSFEAVKFIDIAFDLFVGRGLQALMSFMCYHTFAKALIRMMEHSKEGVTYETFEALGFSTPTLHSVCQLLKRKRAREPFRSKLNMFGIILISIYVIIFPTLVSAISGYASNVDPYMKTPDGSYIVSKSMSEAAFQISGPQTRDWDTKSTIIQRNDSCSGQPPTFMSSSMFTPSDIEAWDGLSTECYAYWSAMLYVVQYGLDKETNIATQLGLKSIDPPRLEVKIFQSGFNDLFSFADALGLDEKIVSKAGSLYDRDPNEFPAGYIYEKNVFDEDYIDKNGSCQPNATYKWGFSAAFLIIVLITNFIWACALLAISTHASWTSKMNENGRELGLFRASVDLALSAIRDIKEYQCVDDARILHMPDHELRRKLRSQITKRGVTFGGEIGKPISAPPKRHSSSSPSITPAQEEESVESFTTPLVPKAFL